LKQAAQSDSDANMISKSCYALLFFGTPNQGMNIETLRSMVNGQPNERLIADLGTESEVLRNLESDFHRCFNKKDLKVVSFYEMKDTPTVQVCAKMLLCSLQRSPA
jgi:hypothetical protein